MGRGRGGEGGGGEEADRVGAVEWGEGGVGRGRWRGG